jgi:hypothetical protein
MTNKDSQKRGKHVKQDQFLTKDNNTWIWTECDNLLGTDTSRVVQEHSITDPTTLADVTERSDLTNHYRKSSKIRRLETDGFILEADKIMVNDFLTNLISWQT